MDLPADRVTPLLLPVLHDLRDLEETLEQVDVEFGEAEGVLVEVLEDVADLRLDIRLVEVAREVDVVLEVAVLEREEPLDRVAGNHLEGLRLRLRHQG